MLMDNVLNSVDWVVKDGMKKTLIQPYIEGEIRRALFQMQPSKALGQKWYVTFLFPKNIGILLG